MQFDFDFTGKLPVSAQIGMNQADENADSRWKRVIDGVILSVARAKSTFTVDDVLEALERLPNAPETHNLAALGPRMKEVSKTLRYMEPTNEVARSRRAQSHGNFLRVWKSLVTD